MENQDLKEKEKTLFFEIRRSIRYHNHRKRFFTWFHNVAAFLAAISGIAIFVAIFAQQVNPAIQITLAFIVAFFSTIDLIIAPPAKVREYEDLARRFIALEKEIIMAENKDAKFFNRIYAEKLSIEADEPAHLRILNAVCFNETVTSMGLDSNALVKIEWYQRLMMHFADLNPGKV